MYFITALLTLVAYSCINYTYSNLQKLFSKDTFQDKIICNETSNNIVEVSPKVENYKLAKLNTTWQIEIPCINLVAPIKEGTTQEVLLTSVGHFENTNIFEGNVGLAAHNRRISYKLF